MYFRCVCFRDELVFLNCDDVGICVVNKQSELLEYIFDSVYDYLQYDEISVTYGWVCVVSVGMWSSLVCL